MKLEALLTLVQKTILFVQVEGGTQNPDFDLILTDFADLLNVESEDHESVELIMALLERSHGNS